MDSEMSQKRISSDDFDQEVPGPSAGTHRPQTPPSDAVNEFPASLNLVDPILEITDPNPNIQDLFNEFNHLLFESKLSGVMLSWSKRLTTEAGACRYNSKTDACLIQLNQPLHSLLKRKDLVESLLHEMIHAYLFRKMNRKHGHGPEYQYHVNHINSVAGTNVSIYHKHTEAVKASLTHWWKCDGQCQKRVKRPTNRVPSARESWFVEHQETCGGKFLKIKGPETTNNKRTRNEDEHDAGPAKRSRE